MARSILVQYCRRDEKRKKWLVVKGGPWSKLCGRWATLWLRVMLAGGCWPGLPGCLLRGCEMVKNGRLGLAAWRRSMPPRRCYAALLL